MTSTDHPASWVPPLLLGSAAAVAAEVTAALLLYAGAGFVRALALVLTVLLASLALGLWSAPTEVEDPVEALRRRWQLTLFAFLVAGMTAYLWTVLGGLSEGLLGRGLGLAFLGALPMYAVGHLVATIASVRACRGLPGPGAWVAFGAALGSLFTGAFLTASATPVTMYGVGLVVVWVGALVHGQVLDRVVGPPGRIVDIASLAPDRPEEEPGSP